MEPKKEPEEQQYKIRWYGNTPLVYCCTCGSLVENTAQHNQWHQHMRRTG